MKLYLTCMTCFQELGRPSDISYPAEIQDAGYYQFKCVNGHISRTRLQNPKFEVLFELGLNAINDGYYREAVSSFTSALERFYEYAIKILFKANELDKALFESLWKQVSNQSERQYGAYLFLYSFVEHDSPPKLSNSKVKFRNEVIHKGKIPTKAEAMSYGEAVVDVILPVLVTLKNKYQEAMNQIVFEQFIEMTPQEDLGKQIATMGIGSALSTTTAETTKPNLDKRLESIEKTKKHYELYGKFT